MKLFWFLISAFVVALVPEVLSQNEAVSVPVVGGQPLPSHEPSFVLGRVLLTGMAATGSEPWTFNLQAAPVEVGVPAMGVSDVPVMSAVDGELLSLPLDDNQRPVPDRPRDYAILPPVPEFVPPRVTRRRLPAPNAVHGHVVIRSATLSPVRVV